MIIKILDIIGYYGPLILVFISIFTLFNKQTLLFTYLIGFGINTVLNILLKSIIQESRPIENKRLFNLEILSGRLIQFDRYGMPSGHTQSVFYSTAFIFMSLKNIRIKILYFIISLLTIYQRLSYKNHSIEQIIVGSIIGSLTGIFFYYMSSSVLKGILREKKDDNAII